MSTLMFRNTVLETISHHGQIWFTSAELAKALEYADPKAVSGLYNNNEDEFATGMSLVVESTTNGINNSLRKIKTRIFSLRGAHLVAMFARTPVAKEFRKWVLDILDREVGQPLPVYQPEAPERFTRNDTRNLARLVWCITRGFRFEQAWTNAVYYALRDVTGTPSPMPFEAQHIPLLAEECRRIYYVTETLRETIHEAEKQTLKRILNHPG
ncbi:BRO family protein [Candidatus Sodalis sp. SoCistrobi]|uniref:BRO-N domain-containing protein n=1 Tax=Candidatus Sodalis sp. SoCistrobi TaxID=1922216 RepID=UPI000A0013A2|nr:BRO family protein [Candidatus Sodalis sp. SoCistrobi]